MNAKCLRTDKIIYAEDNSVIKSKSYRTVSNDASAIRYSNSFGTNSSFRYLNAPLPAIKHPGLPEKACV